MGLLSLLLGCDELGMKPTYSMDDSAGEEVFTDIAVDLIDPAYGALAGGTAVTISGQGFVGDVSVAFGNMALDITVVDAKTIVFSTPSSPSEGAVDVHIQSDLGSVTLDEGFQYTNSAPEPASEPTNEPTNEPTDEPDTGNTNSSGLTGGMVELWRKLYACPSCFGLTPNLEGQFTQVIEASFAVHTPVQGSWYAWLPPLNSCITQLNQVSLASSQQLSSVSITGPGSINLTYDGNTGTYLNPNISSNFWSYNTYYSLETSDFSVSSALKTPDDAFTVLEPSLAFASEGFLQGFSKSNFTLLWEPYGTTDYIFFVLEASDTIGNPSYVLCLTEDIGGFTLDPSLLANLATYQGNAVHLYRLQVLQSIHPQNSSIIEGVSAIGLIGTGYLTE